MRYQHIIEAVYHQPWLITASGHAAIRSLIESHLAQTATDVKAQREGEGPCGEHVELDQMQIIDGIAHIPVGGVMGQRLSKFEKGSGAIDVNDIRHEIETAEASEEVRGIVFDIDSPGGMVGGTPELASRVKQIRKPKYAYVNLAASAAYWFASATDGIFGTTTSEVGSIGVYIPWIDSTQWAAQRGIKVDLIKSGQYKGLGYPGTSLTPEQRNYLQDRVNTIYSMFSETVRANRGDIKSEHMQGQTFLASEALNIGLLDGIVESKADVVRMI